MEGVVKVINPNVTAKTDIIYRTLKKTFERLVEEEGDKYRPLLYILEDIRAWIMADVDLPASAALDEDFRAANVGQTSASGRFESKVPDVYLSNSKFVIEQFVDGKTLQRMKVASEGEVGEVTDFIRLRFLEQIMEGVVHSNIHPDNFKVTEDGHLYWLDRTLLLKLSEEEQGLLISSGLQESNEDRMRTFVAGLLGLEDNKGVGEEVGQQLLDDIEPLLSENMEEMIKNVFILLRQRDVQIPLNITLVFNNILAILKMDQYIGKSSTA